MPLIDLNVDLGEGGRHDAELIALASSANIACGGHAGDEYTMRTAIDLAQTAGTAIGAHPGYEDREHFGRRPLKLTEIQVADLISRQLERLLAAADRAGASLHHLKPHGALYHQADQSKDLAEAVMAGIRRLIAHTRIYAPPGGELERAAGRAEFDFSAEGFADRRYQADGSLVPRGEDHTVIDDPALATAQALRIAQEQHVIADDDSRLALPARTLCVHGDNEAAVSLLRNIREALEGSGITIQA